MCLSAVLALQQQRALERIDLQRHTQQAQSARQALEMRLDAYAVMVQHVANQLAASPEMGQSAFARMAQALRIQAQPGMQALSFTRAATQRGLPGQDQAFTARPGPHYFFIDYLWPLEGNESLPAWTCTTAPASWPAWCAAATARPPWSRHRLR